MLKPSRRPGRQGKDVMKLQSLPLAIPNSPAVSRARVASLGKWSRTTEAAMVIGRSASASWSGSGGAEDGEGGDESSLGDGEAMVFVLCVVLIDERSFMRLMKFGVRRCGLLLPVTVW